MADPALEHLVAPVDPRLVWDLPALGAMPRHAELDPHVTRVLADNASLLTLDGTNTYVIGAPGSGEVLVVDPGPDDAAHLAAIDDAAAARDAQVVAVLVTHHHIDHAESAAAVASRLGARLLATTADVAGDVGTVIADGDVLRVGGVEVTAVATPGHCHDHVAYRLDHGPMLVGDHILGRGTSVVTHPDGDLTAYLESLRRVLDVGPDALYPGHGPQMAGDDPLAVVRYYLKHRAFREQQILALLAEGPQDTSALVRRIYADVDPQLWPAAAASTRSALDKMSREGRVIVEPGQPARLAVL